MHLNPDNWTNLLRIRMCFSKECQRRRPVARRGFCPQNLLRYKAPHPHSAVRQTRLPTFACPPP